MSYKKVSCIPKGCREVQEVPFESLRKGDIFFVNGESFTVNEDAHYSGDASYDGYLLYDSEGNSWFPEDLDVGCSAPVMQKPPLSELIRFAENKSPTSLGESAKRSASLEH